MLNQYAVDTPTLPVNQLFSHLIQFLVESVAERDIGERPQENAPGESHAEHLGEVVPEESSRGGRSRSLRINGRATLRRAPFDPHARQPVVNGLKSWCFGLSSERTGR